MATITSEERDELAVYRDAILPLVEAWTESLDRAFKLRAQTRDRADDMGWRMALTAEVRAWREILNRLPGEPPPNNALLPG